MSRLDLLRATNVGRHLANVTVEEPLPEDTTPDHERDHECDHESEAPDTVRDHPPSTLRQAQV